MNRCRLLLTGIVAGALSLASGLAHAQDTDRLRRLETGIERADAIRAIKRVQQTYNHYLDAGLWNDSAELTTATATLTIASGGTTMSEASSRGAIRDHWMKDAGRAAEGLAEGQLNTHLLLQPIVNLGADGTTAKGTWHELAMLGQTGKSATWAGGIYENEYALENGVWKISRIHFTEQYRGAYEDPGQKAPPRWEIPYHFTAEHVGLTIPPSALTPAPSKTAPASVATLTARLQRLHDETDVQNLQNSYGYYVDRKMWDDVADLFASDGTYDPGKHTTYKGNAEIRRALETLYGGPGLKYGELWDHILLSTVVTISADGRTARALGTELAMLGLLNDYQRWELGAYVNEFVKDAGVWKIKSLRYYPRLVTDYDKGWAKQAPTPYPAGAIKAALANPPPPKPVPAAKIEALELMLAQAIGVDATENLNSAYGYYLDESAWDDVAEICASNCLFELSDVGVYIGKDRTRQSLKLRYPNSGRGPNGFTIHQLTQPVIHVSADAKTARGRFRLFQGGGSASGASASWIGGIYENQAFFENGEWKYGVKDLQHIFNATYRNGWAKIAPRTPAAVGARGAAPAGPRAAGANASAPRGLAAFPPDRPQRSRQYVFPEIDEPAFHYKNPVSGRAPSVLLP